MSRNREKHSTEPNRDWREVLDEIRQRLKEQARGGSSEDREYWENAVDQTITELEKEAGIHGDKPPEKHRDHHSEPGQRS